MRTILTLAAGVWGFVSPAEAKTVKGPQVSMEEAQATDILPADESRPDARVKRRRTEVNLLIPIPAEFLGGMLVMKDDFFKEERVYSGDDTGQEPDDVKNPNVAGLGAVYLPHPKEGAPRAGRSAARYGELSIFRDKARPMSEYGIGADIADTDMPFSLKFAPTDQAETRLFVRYRQFPGFDKWLVLVGHKIVQNGGFSLDVTIPQHVLVGFDFPSWGVYTGIRWVSREYPFEAFGTRGWVDGYVSTRLIGVRRQLIGPLYLALEGGVQKEDLRYVDEKGEELAVHSTDFAPWAKAALETWIKTP